MAELPLDEPRVRGLLDRVHESTASMAPGLEGLFEEIRGTLGVPFVGSFFRALALDPTLLRSLWQTLAPVLRSEQAEREVGRLLQHALFVAPSLDLGAEHRAWLNGRGLDAGGMARIAAVNKSVQYAVARMLLAAAATALALDPDAGLAAAPAAVPALRARPFAIAAGAVRPEPVALDGRNPALERRLEGLRQRHGHLAVAGYYRALGQWPAYLERAEIDLGTIVGSLRYRACAELLATLAEVGIRGLLAPARPAFGDGLVLEDARALVSYYQHRLLPDLLIDATFLRALDDDARRARSLPFAEPAA